MIFARAPARRSSLVGLLTGVLLVFAMTGTASAHHYDRLLPPATKCGGAKQTNTALPVKDQEAAMYCLHNAARRRADRVEVTRHSRLHTSARRKSADMLRCQEMTHYPCGDDIWRRIREVGYMKGCYGVAENIAYGTGSRGNARATMRRWLHSDPHRTNILNGRFRDLGAGLVKGTYRGSRAQLWTGHLGYHC